MDLIGSFYFFRISSAALPHTHLDASGGVHFHPYCFACNPSVVHLFPSPTPPPQLMYPTPPASHIYSRPTSVSGGGYPSPVQLRTYGSSRHSKGPKVWETETSEDSSGRERITVRLRPDEYNGLGFIVSSRDGTPYSSSGVRESHSIHFLNCEQLCPSFL